MLSILQNPHIILRQKAAMFDVSRLGLPETEQLIQEMAETMYGSDGIGLAAPQIGQSIRLIVINTKNGVLPLVNPVITKFSKKTVVDEEGCLSVPGATGRVRRAYKISVEAVATTGEIIKFEAKGLFARVIQHEIDHLDGILFIDKLEK